MDLLEFSENTIKELRNRKVCRFTETEQTPDSKLSVFHPLNIFYIRKHKERGIFTVNLLYPKNVIKNNQVVHITTYKIKFDSVKEILSLLKRDFIKVGNGLIVRKYSIIKIDTVDEQITIRRFLPVIMLVKHSLKKDVTLTVGRGFLKNLKDEGIFTKVLLPRDIKTEGISIEFNVDGKLMINPIDICYILKKAGRITVVLTNDFKTKQPRSLAWDSRKSFEELIRDFSGEGFLIQVNRNCILSLYSLMSSPKLNNNSMKLFINEANNEWILLKVGATFKSEIEKNLLYINYNSFEKEVFEICNFDKRQTEFLFKKKRKKVIDIEIIPPFSQNLAHPGWHLLGEKEHIGKVYSIELKKQHNANKIASVL